MLNAEEAFDCIASLGNIEIHDHVGMIYEGQEMMLRNMARLVRQAHLRGDRSIVLTVGVPKASLARVMEDIGISSERYLLNGFYEHRDFISPKGFGADAESAMDLILAHQRKGMRLGYHNIWVLIDVRLLQEMERDQRIAFESLCNQMMDEEQMVQICFYDIASLSGEALMDFISTHQLLWYHGILCHNYFYNPPEDMVRNVSHELSPELLLDKLVDIQMNELTLHNDDTSLQGLHNRLVEEVRKRESLENSYLAMENNYRQALDALGDQVFVLDRELKVVMANRPFHDFVYSMGYLGEIIGRRLTDIMPVDGETINDYHKVFLTGRSFIKDEDLVIDGTSYLAEIIKVPMFEDDRPKKVMTTIRGVDIKGKMEFSPLPQVSGRTPSNRPSDPSTTI